MKCPNRKAGLPDMPPFPHEYHHQAEYLLKLMEYNMRVRLWDFIRAAETLKYGLPVKQVLALAVDSQAKKFAQDAADLLGMEIAGEKLKNLLNELGMDGPPSPKD